MSGDNAASSALANAVLELSADVKDLTKAVERQVQSNERVAFQSTRIANASEETQAMAETEVRESRVLKEKLLERLDSLESKVAVLIDNVKDAEKAADNAAGEAKVAARIADNSRSMALPPLTRDPGPPARDEDAPERELEEAPSDKSAVGYGFRAFALFLRAKGDTKAWLLALIALIGIFVLAYFNIINSKRADELEHEGASIHGKAK